VSATGGAPANRPASRSPIGVDAGVGSVSVFADVHQLKMFSKWNGVALVGPAGNQVIATRDSGAHWTVMKPPSADAVPFPLDDGTTAWITPASGTCEGVASDWSSTRVTYTFINPVQGWAIGCHDSAMGGQQTVEVDQTLDGGQHWTLAAAENRNGSHRGWIDPSGWKAFLRFRDATHGFICCEAGASVLATSDGGKTFSPVALPGGLPGWKVQQGEILFPGEHDMVLTANVIDDSGSGTPWRAFVSHDDGATFKALAVDQDGQGDLSMIDDGHAVYLDPTGHVQMSTDGGKTWSSGATTLAGGTLDFIQPDVGWVWQCPPGAPTCVLAETTDGGKTFNTLIAPPASAPGTQAASAPSTSPATQPR
jgi:photosystem II stability/assembly factor-like uncharacterized protein